MPKNYKIIPMRKNAKLAAERGILRYRVMKQNGELLRVAVTKKPGPRGGHTIITAKLKEIKKS